MNELLEQLDELLIEIRAECKSDSSLKVVKIMFLELNKLRNIEVLARVGDCPYCLGTGKETASGVKVRCRFCSGSGRA